MTTKNKELQAKSNETVKRFLERRGYDIIEVGWTTAFGTADIIAMDDGTLVFVDVKASFNPDSGLPSDVISAAYRENHERIATAFLAENDYVGCSLRFDIVSLKAISDNKTMIRHQINAMAVAA